MRRSIEEVRSEIERKSEEYERRKKARVKSLGIGAGAALMLLIAAAPVIGSLTNDHNKAPLPESVLASGTQHPQPEESGCASAENRPMNGEGNLKPPRDDQTDFAPNAAEPTTMPGDSSNSGSHYGGTEGDDPIEADGYYDPESGMFDWYDEMRGEYRSFPRSGIEPQWAMIVVSDESGSHTHEIWNSGAAAALLSLFFELHDSTQFFEVIDTIDPDNPRSIEYKVRVIKDDLHFDIIKFADGSFGFDRFSGILMWTDAASEEAFDTLVERLCREHPAA